MRTLYRRVDPLPTALPALPDLAVQMLRHWDDPSWLWSVGQVARWFGEQKPPFPKRKVRKAFKVLEQAGLVSRYSG